MKFAKKRQGPQGNVSDVTTTNVLNWATGQVFAGYTIERALGAGGMGAVYLAAHPRLPRHDALKVLPPDLSADAEYRARFEREADLAAGLSHPHIVRIHDRGEEDGLLWIAMAYVAGTDAARLLRERFPAGMPLHEVVPIISAVADALDFAHHRGLLHRDVKPANILLAEAEWQQRRIYLADFGVARRVDDDSGLTETNTTMGTVDYAAPEQLQGATVDGHGDQYALACTAFHLLTGVAPYQDANPATVIARHVSAPPPSFDRAELAGLDAVFAKAMAKDPSARFGSCREFADRLAGQLGPQYAYAAEISEPTDIQHTRPGTGVTWPALHAPPTRSRRGRVLAGAGLAAALLVAGGVVAGVKLTGHPNPAAGGQPGSGSSPAPAGPTQVPNTGPLTGIYQVDYGVVTGVDGQKAPHATPTTETWGFRSMCGSSGCVATASRVTGDTMQLTSIVLDQVGDRWVAVTVGTSTCANVEGEAWETFTLQPRPDGTLVGEATETMGRGCANKRPVTLTRTSDVDLSTLPDPAKLPPRANSPAAALHGRYHQMTTQPNGFKDQSDWVARTDCLRAGDRCLSLFHAPPGSAMVLVFADGTWTYEREFDGQCWKGGQTHVKIVVPFAMPQPVQDPVASISGHGHETLTGACPSTDVDVKFTRTGD